MRAFFGIPIQNQLQWAIRETAEHLRSQTRMRASWVPQQNYHITLRFLGDIDPDLSVDLDDLCRAVCQDLEPFECIMDRVGSFPSVDRARVIWVGGEASPSFRRLSQALSDGLVDLGFPETRKESWVHVTLARIKDRPDPALPGLISELNPIAPLKMPVDHIALMESTLTPQGVVYSPLFTTRLGGSKG
ncbi:RNA 2',3'-cyclic phosphodiesterase [Candidatus Bipolaricaulota bacterium]|nr:RNA 2',3'-cyclic phosphodiesterase [Candidatus Bipolaricaulota bacterium]MCK5585270.1 RNA 2',3'-cyclic phosphodiesterase [Candidatus Bipolaricaulota bacterium]